MADCQRGTRCTADAAQIQMLAPQKASASAGARKRQCCARAAWRQTFRDRNAARQRQCNRHAISRAGFRGAQPRRVTSGKVAVARTAASRRGQNKMLTRAKKFSSTIRASSSASRPGRRVMATDSAIEIFSDAPKFQMCLASVSWTGVASLTYTRSANKNARI